MNPRWRFGFAQTIMAKAKLPQDQLRLYTLIYNRFVASQMNPAVFAITNVEVSAAKGIFKAQGKVMKFDGYRKVLPPAGKQEDALLPLLTEKQALDLLKLNATQHFTEPPPRYNEASLVKTLEKEGIGRPSTYASIIRTIQERDPYQHPCSIHNLAVFYDHAKPWVTHLSVQRSDLAQTRTWREQYRKPAVVDECGYEGNIPPSWGNISAEEMVHRFWEGTVNGGYVGHGETFLHPEDILWWAKGGSCAARALHASRSSGASWKTVLPPVLTR